MILPFIAFMGVCICGKNTAIQVILRGNKSMNKIESNGKPKKEGRLHKLKVTKIQMLCLMI